jgi:uncharacterized membrane protein YfcA
MAVDSVSRMPLRTRRFSVAAVGVGALIYSFATAVGPGERPHTERYLEAFAVGIVLGVLFSIPYQRWWRRQARWDTARQKRFMPVAVGIGLIGAGVVQAAPKYVTVGFFSFFGVSMIFMAMYLIEKVEPPPPRPDVE